MTDYHLAQINIARFKAPLEDNSMKEFVDFLESVNKFAEESPGFVWRLKDEEGRPSTYIASPFENDPLMAINMSVWEDIDSFKNFVYHSVHSYFLKSKKKWFTPIERPHAVMWWIKKGEIPTVTIGKEKLDLYEKSGPTAAVFSFRELFDASGQRVG